MTEGPAQASRFEAVPISMEAGKARWFEVPLAQNLLKLQDGHEFALIRFTAPMEPGLDMVWSFAAPPDWGSEGDGGGEGEKKEGGFHDREGCMRMGLDGDQGADGRGSATTRKKRREVFVVLDAVVAGGDAGEEKGGPGLAAR